MIKIQVTKGIICIDVCDLLQELTDDEQVKMIESLSCADAVVKHVADQLLEGWTENGYYGGRAGDGEPAMSSPLDQARRRIALGAGKVAQETIEAQQRTIELKEQSNREVWRKYHEVTGAHRDF